MQLNGAIRKVEIKKKRSPSSIPAWTNTLLLLLDYAIVEGVRRGLGSFVCLLELARKDLEGELAGRSDGETHPGQ